MWSAPLRALLAAPLLALLLALVSASGPAARRAPVALPPGVWNEALRISGSRLEADVRYLADDRFEGRAAGTRGHELAARYMATRMALLGLTPAGTDGFLTEVPFLRSSLVESASSLALVNSKGIARPLELSVDALLYPEFVSADRSIEAPLAFVGFGVSAPELGHDDFAGLDVRGKVLVEFRGAPPRFPHNERAYHSNSRVKEAQAAARGAVGVLSMLTPEEQRKTTFERTVRQGRLPGFRWVDDEGAPANVERSFAVNAALSPAGIERLFAGAPRTFAQVAADAESSRAGGFAFETRLRSRRVSALSKVTSPNVVGLLEGSDPRLAGECIVLSAHLDHLGISTPVEGDSINNGAYDNASGCAMLLEVARALKALPKAPRRSVLFLAVTAEEKGLQGSDHFARHAAPLGLEVVGNVNLDMVLTLTPMKQVILYGGEHSSLGPVFERAASLAGLTPAPDPMPSEVVFVRSDQFSFIKQGVPGIFPVSGGDGSAEGRARIADWRRDRYHSPSDDMDQPFHWDSAARFTRMAMVGTWMLAEQRERPSWNRGDFFGERFARER